MNNRIHKKLILGTILAGAVTFPALAQEESGAYFGFGVGPSLVDDVDLDVRGSGVSGTASFTTDPGIRLDLIPGYRINRHFAVEFNTGVIWNGLDEIEVPGGSAELEGDLLQVPLLLNAVGRFPIGDTRFTPYALVGGGGVYEYLSIDSVAGMSVEDSGDDIYAAIQAGAGIDYALSESFSVGVAYRYLHAFTSESGFVPGVGNYDLDDVRTHSLNLTLRLDY